MHICSCSYYLFIPFYNEWLVEENGVIYIMVVIYIYFSKKYSKFENGYKIWEFRFSEIPNLIFLQKLREEHALYFNTLMKDFTIPGKKSYKND